MDKKKLKCSELREGKEYKANCPYWYNAVFFKDNGLLRYRLDSGSVYYTSYDMYPGLNNCTYIEYIEQQVEEAPVQVEEETSTFLDDAIDSKLKKYEELLNSHKHDYTYEPPSIHEFLEMKEEKWRNYVLDRIDRNNFT